MTTDEVDNENDEDQPVNDKGELPTLDEEAESFIDEANEDKAVTASAGVYATPDDSKLPEPIGLLADEEDVEEEPDDDEPPVKPKRLTKKQKNSAIVERIRSCRKEMKLTGRLSKKKRA